MDSELIHELVGTRFVMTDERRPQGMSSHTSWEPSVSVGVQPAAMRAPMGVSTLQGNQEAPHGNLTCGSVFTIDVTDPLVVLALYLELMRQGNIEAATAIVLVFLHNFSHVKEEHVSVSPKIAKRLHEVLRHKRVGDMLYGFELAEIADRVYNDALKHMTLPHGRVF